MINREWRPMAPVGSRAVVGTWPGGTASGPLAQWVFDAMPLAVLAADAGRRPLVMNRRSRDVLAERDGLLLEGGRLVAASPDSEDQLLAAFGVVLASGAAGSESVLVPRTSGRPPLRVELAQLPLGRTEHRRGGVCAIVVIHETSAAARCWTQEKAAYGLTAAEVRVAELLLAGRGADDIAATLGVAESTVRTHVKHLFAKTGVRRQHELVVFLMSTHSA